MYFNKVLSYGKQVHLYSNTYFGDHKFRELFHELFKPTDDLQKSINENISAIGGDYIAMVFRFQQLLGDFKEGDFKVLSETDQSKLIVKCIKEIEKKWNGKAS